MTASSRRLNAIVIAGNLYHIVFTEAEGSRLLNDPDRDDSNVTLTTCQILSDSLIEVAVGRAMHVPPDEFQVEVGDWLSLARALDDGADQGLWALEDSCATLDVFLTATGLQDRLNSLGEDVWFGAAFMAADTAEAEAKVLMLALQEQGTTPAPAKDMTPKLVKKDAPIFWQDPEPEWKNLYWMWDGEPHVMRRNTDFRIESSHFTPHGMDSTGYIRVADPRTPAPASLSLNDQFRADAKRLGVPLETTVGALTMRDLSRVYHAMMANTTLPGRFRVSSEALNESFALTTV